MASSDIYIETTVLPGNRIELHVPELPVGRKVTVLLLLEDSELPKRPVFEVLGDYAGGQLFRSAEEVDEYLRNERDSWDQ
jgi:hypothetical protein